ncbi:MAG: hypothetical protein ACKVYV_19520 [Limisphaerales bacterium]
MRTLPALLATLAVTLLPPTAPAQAVPASPSQITSIFSPSGTIAGMPHAGTPEDPQFDLDFPGGSPASLVDTLAAASGHPVNVILPEDAGNVSLPPMKLRGVTVPEVFEAITQASRRTVERDVARSDGRTFRQRFAVSYGFRPAGRPAHDGIWIYFAELPPPELPPEPVIPPRAPEPQVDPTTGQMVRPQAAAAPIEEVRVLNLSPFLQAGRSVEDITTAIRTACDLLPGGGQPKLTFHKETNLLLTRGRPDQLELIEQVLAQIRESPPAPAPPGTVTAPFRMSPELMRRYGLTPADKPVPAPAAEETPRVP